MTAEGPTSAERRAGLDRRQQGRVAADDRRRLAATIQRLRLELARLRGELPDAPAGELPADAARLLATAEARAAAAEQRAATAEERAATADKRSQDLGSRLAEIGGALKEARDRLDDLEAAPRVAEPDVAAAGRVAVLEAQLMEATATIAGLRDANSGQGDLQDALRRAVDAEAQVAAAGRQAHMAESRAADLERRLADLEGRLTAEQATTGPLRAQVAELTGARDALTADLMGTRERLAATESERTSLQARVTQVEADLAAAAEGARALETRLQEMERSVAEQRAVTVEAERAVSEARTTLEEERVRAQQLLNDEREAAEARRAEQALGHRRDVDRLEHEWAARLEISDGRVAELEARLVQAGEDLAARAAQIDHLSGEIEAARGEVNVLRSRLREEIEGRAVADQRRVELDEELAFMRNEVMGPERRRGIFRRRPGPSRATPAPPSRDDAAAPPPAAPEPDEDVEQALERRLFGG